MRKLIIARLQKTKTWYEEVPGSEWIKIACMNPDHIDSKPSAGINTDTGIHHCFSCNHNFLYMQEDEDDTLSEADALWKAKYQNYTKQVTNEHPEHITRITELFLPPVDHMLGDEWRGLSADLLGDAKAYYCSRGKYKGRYVFVFYQGNQHYGFDARTVDATANMVGAKWIRNIGAPVKDLVYPMEVIKKRFGMPEHIVVVEGVADALSYIQMGVPAIASFGLTAPSSRRIEELIRMGVKKITLAFDNDQAGIDGMVKVLPLYAEWFEIVAHPMVAMVRNSGYKDANEFLVGVKSNGVKVDKTFEEGDY